MNVSDETDNTAELHTVRDMMAGSPGVTRAEWMTPGRKGADGTLRITLSNGVMVRADLTVIGRRGDATADGES